MTTSPKTNSGLKHANFISPTDIHGLSKGRARVYVARASAGRIYLCKFLEIKSKSQAIMQGVLVWKSRIPTNSDSFKKLRKKVIKPILKYPKSIPRKP
jgi:hypothetical protein